jgi:REP element-mobilizing transposase RayT
VNYSNLNIPRIGISPTQTLRSQTLHMRPPRLKVLHQSAVYHILSRITQQQQWLGLAERAYLMQLLSRVAEYCGVEILTFCLMSDHFSLLVRIPQKDTADTAVDGSELIRRVELLYGIQEHRIQAWQPSGTRSVLTTTDACTIYPYS